MVSAGLRCPTLGRHADTPFRPPPIRATSAPMRWLVILLLTLLTAFPASARDAGPRVHTVLDVGAPLGPGDYVWDDDGVPAGPMRLVVDLSRRRIYAYRGGVEVGRAFAVTGSPVKPTPAGSFTILSKDANHRSRTYNNAPMPWSLQLTRGWVAIHGSPVEQDWVTHGCIGVPPAFAKILYARARVGDSVLVTRRWLPAAYE
jgi:hypothetical protein